MLVDHKNNSLDSLVITENKVLLNAIGNLTDHVKIALEKFECHSRIINIHEVETKFSFTNVRICEIEVELRNSKTKKESTFMNISTKQNRL